MVLIVVGESPNAVDVHFVARGNSFPMLLSNYDPGENGANVMPIFRITRGRESPRDHVDRRLLTLLGKAPSVQAFPVQHFGRNSFEVIVCSHPSVLFFRPVRFYVATCPSTSRPRARRC